MQVYLIHNTLNFHLLSNTIQTNSFLKLLYCHLILQSFLLQSQSASSAQPPNSIPIPETQPAIIASQANITQNDKTNVYSKNQQSETSIYIKQTTKTTNYKIKYILQTRIIRDVWGLCIVLVKSD